MASPIETSIGSDSPVIAAASTDPIPSTILPSTANRSPERTTTQSPTLTSEVLISISVPSLRIKVFSGTVASNALTASVADLRARTSNHLPNKTTVGTTAATSKYISGIACAELNNSNIIR